MAVPKKRRSYRDFVLNDNDDGLEINRTNGARFIGRRRSTFSMFDADNIVIDLEGRTENGRHYHKVSVLGEIRRVNISKSKLMNRYNHLVKGR